jgi:hypothetical protein
MKHSLTFLSGVAVAALAAYCGGGGMRPGILIGAGLVVGIMVAWPRQAARVLLALADGLAAFRLHWTIPPPALASRQLKLTPGPASTLIDTLTPVQIDVASALQNLGVSRKRASLAAQQATAEDFETAFREAQKAAA